MVMTLVQFRGDELNQCHILHVSMTRVTLIYTFPRTYIYKKTWLINNGQEPRRESEHYDIAWAGYECKYYDVVCEY